jgi:hypothetical protein
VLESFENSGSDGETCPPLAESTAKKKKGTVPPIDTGNLRIHITYKIEKK